ncbi:uncharacterized protein LOC141901722 [Tubulanus polymorphus]|uniref:uncharacterized protein LOC141901722 n=1 Tax=Tubulanus polymorphus TaxID=672921 RepID=UPI003DA2391D
MAEDEEGEYLYSLLADDRHIIESLLDVSDRCFPLPEDTIDNDAILFSTKIITGWIPTTRTKRKKFDFVSQQQSSDNNNNGNKKHVLSPSSVGFFDWKSVVEPDTYRYVHNNSYHRMKVNHRMSAKNDSSNYQRLRNIRRQLTADQHALQREIRRDLKKEAGAKQSGTNFGLNHSQSDVNISNNKRSKSSSPAPKEIVLTADDITSSLQALDLPNLLTKSFSEKMVENFSEKMVALEEEMKKDLRYKLRMRRQTEPADKLQKIAADLETLNSNASKKSHPSKNSLRNNSKHVPKLDALAQETFHVRSVLKSNQSTMLRPLTKVTPHQRMCDDNHKMLLTQLKFSKSLSEADTLVPPCTYAWDNDCYSAPSAVPVSTNDGNKRNKFANLEEAILSRAIKKIIPQRRVSQTPQKEHKSKFRKAVNVTPSHPASNAPISTVVNDEQNMNCYVRKASIPGQHSVAAMFLPELSGKRMEISTTNHRIT